MAPTPPPPTLSTSQKTMVLRVALFILLFISMIILVSDTVTVQIGILSDFFPTIKDKVHFTDVYAYRYVLVSIVLAFVCSMFQMALSVNRIVKGNSILSEDRSIIFDFYGDKVISYMIATGSAAGFGATKDLQTLADALELDFGDYFDKAYATATLLLFAFFCAAALSVISSYRLPKQENN